MNAAAALGRAERAAMALDAMAYDDLEIMPSVCALLLGRGFFF